MENTVELFICSKSTDSQTSYTTITRNQNNYYVWVDRGINTVSSEAETSINPFIKEKFSIYNKYIIYRYNQDGSDLYEILKNNFFTLKWNLIWVLLEVLIKIEIELI